MTVVSAIRELLSRGLPLDQALIAAEVLEAKLAVPAPSASEAPSTPRTARQLRNARYYQRNKDRLKASKSQPSKTIETPPDASRTVSDAFRLNSDADLDAPRARVEENLFTPTLADQRDSGGATSQQRPKTGSLASKTQARQERNAVRELLLECLPSGTADALIAHRETIRMALSVHTARHLLVQFKATGNPADAADMMVSRGWRGFQIEWYEREKSNGTNKSVHDAARRLQDRVHSGQVSFGEPPPSPIRLLRTGSD
jgi:hypothetical protein